MVSKIKPILNGGKGEKKKKKNRRKKEKKKEKMKTKRISAVYNLGTALETLSQVRGKYVRTLNRKDINCIVIFRLT